MMIILGCISEERLSYKTEAKFITRVENFYACKDQSNIFDVITETLSCMLSKGVTFRSAK